MVATTDKLSKLHGKLADVLAEAMEDMDTQDPIALQGNVQVMKLVSSFLKDNNITSDLDKGEGENEKLAKLAKLKERRTVVQTPLDMLN